MNWTVFLLDFCHDDLRSLEGKRAKMCNYLSQGDQI